MFFKKAAWLGLGMLLALTASAVARGDAAPAFPVDDTVYAALEEAALADGGTGAALSLGEVLWLRIKASPFNLVASLLFLGAILHTFAAPFFTKVAHRFDEKLREDVRAGRVTPNAEGVVSSFPASLFHFLGEVEAVFGLWAAALFAGMCAWPGIGWSQACEYMAARNFVEPVFVVIIMAMASTRPVVELAARILGGVAILGRGTPGAWWFSILTLGPCLGSFITEPAAMTLAALLLARQFYALAPSKSLSYATLGLLFVNVSVGGTLTNFAAPPVLMVAAKWEWSVMDMLTRFGWKAFVGIIISNVIFWIIFRREFARMNEAWRGRTGKNDTVAEKTAPVWVVAVHLAFLAWTVLMLLNHQMTLFVAGFLFFMGFVTATARYQQKMELRGPLMVGFFLAGLVVHGGLQAWWMGPLLGRLTEVPLFLGATVLTGFNDNAAITYLASQAPTLSLHDASGALLTGDAYETVSRLRYAVMAGAVTGGGLTVIANAPNPAGQSILSKFFDGGVSPLWLFAWALAPTVIIGGCFMLLPY